MLAREQEQATNTQATLRSQQSASSRKSISYNTIYNKISFIAEQATNQNLDYEPTSIQESIQEDNWKTVWSNKRTIEDKKVIWFELTHDFMLFFTYMYIAGINQFFDNVMNQSWVESK